VKTLILTPEKEKLEDIIAKAVSVLRSSGVVVFPTETVYGIGADAFNLTAVNKIFEIKGRAKDNPLIFHVSSTTMVEKLAHINSFAKKIVKTFWPGPLTLVLKSKVDRKYSFGLDTVAVRMPENYIALKLIESLDSPVVAPSANISGKPSSTDFIHVYNDFNGKVDCIIDGGKTVYGIESTVIDVSEENVCYLLRPGAFSVEDLEEKGIKVVLPESNELKKRSPGTRYRHYAPDKPLFLFENENELATIYEEIKNKKVGYMGLFDTNFKTSEKIVFKNLVEYAKMLFATLRYLDCKNIDVIVAELPSNKGLGRAVRDRLLRASGVSR